MSSAGRPAATISLLAGPLTRERHTRGALAVAARRARGAARSRPAARIVLGNALMNALRRTWVWSLGLAMAAVAALPSQALATPFEPGREHPLSLMRHPEHRIATRGIDPGSIAICLDLRDTPLGPCPRELRLPVPFGPPPSLVDVHRIQTEENTAEAVKREILAAARLRTLGAQIPILYGIEGEPLKQFELKREILVGLARLSGDSRVMTAALGVGPSSTLRAFVEGDFIPETRVRGTYVEIEDLRGENPLVPTVAQELTFASIGAGLFGLGAGTHAVFRRAMGAYGDNLQIHPQPWPPGVTIKGSFSVL
jgi:hypothetical protein